MAIKSILTNQEDFTGEFPVTSRTSALWRFNEKTPDENLQLIDSSGHGRHFTISGWSGTSANLIAGRFGRYFRQNIVNPTSEKTHLIADLFQKEQISHLPTRKHTGRDKQTEVQSCPLSAISAHSQPLLISEP